MIRQTVSGRKSPIIRVSDVAEIVAECPSCGRLSVIQGIPGDWSIGYGCTCFPPAERDRLVRAASDEIRDEGLVACPQCNRLMPNACGARCRHCGFKFSCSGEP